MQGYYYLPRTAVLIFTRQPVNGCQYSTMRIYIITIIVIINNNDSENQTCGKGHRYRTTGSIILSVSSLRLEESTLIFVMYLRNIQDPLVTYPTYYWNVFFDSPLIFQLKRR